MAARKGMCVWSGCSLPAWSLGDNLCCPRHSMLHHLTLYQVADLQERLGRLVEIHNADDLEWLRDTGHRYLIFGVMEQDGPQYVVQEIYEVAETVSAPVVARAR